MTQDELDLISDFVIKKIKSENVPNATNILADVRRKWYSDHNGPYNWCSSLMGEAVGNGPHTHIVWESIRKLVCIICGVSGFHQMRDDERKEYAAYAAEKLTAIVYELITDANFKKLFY